MDGLPVDISQHRTTQNLIIFNFAFLPIYPPINQVERDFKLASSASGDINRHKITPQATHLMKQAKENPPYSQPL
jgi:hypothetical protein